MRLKVLTLTLAVVVSACTEDPVQPTRAPSPTASAAVQARGTGRSIVEFNGQLRKDFRNQVAALGGTVNFVAEGAGFAGVTGLSASAAATLGRSPGIAAVYDDIAISAAPLQRGATPAGEISPLSPSAPQTALLFSWQWNMLAINAPAAWQAGYLGSPTVTAAILDTGLDYDNFDLNGVVDLSRSTSFVPTDDALLGALFPGRNPLDDLVGHGTLTSALVASNGLVFAGVTSRTRLIGVKVVGATGGTLGSVLAGIIWAADHGADVANLSIGFEGGVDKRGLGGVFTGLVNRVMNYANRAGMVLVVSAGNDAQFLSGGDGRNYAAFCESPHVICVSATGPTAGADPFMGPWTNVDAPADYTNFGKQDITVAAPGGTEFGFVTGLCARHFIQVVNNAPTFPCISGTFVLGGFGTSGSAPHVTGVVAQLIAKYGKGKPSQIKQLLINGVDDLGAPGKDPFYGYGRVNLMKALSQ